MTLAPEQQIWAEKAVFTAAFVLVALLVRLALSRIVLPRISNPERRYAIAKTTRYVLLAFLSAGLLWTWIGDRTGLATYLGIASAGLAIALQQPLMNLVGWLYIVGRHPYQNGDRIEIGPHKGDVVDIGMMHTTLIEVGNWVQADQSTGRLLHVPNAWAITQATANATEGFGFVWEELPITVTFESDWREAKRRIEEAVAVDADAIRAQAERQMHASSDEYVIFYRNLTPIVWTSLGPNGVTLTARFLCEPRRRRSTKADLTERVLDAFKQQPVVELAYPTTRFFERGEHAVQADPPLDRE